MPETKILPIDATKLGKITVSRPEGADALLEEWDIEWAASGPDVAHLRQAAQELREGKLPVAFPTETVYGLGADATSSAAVRGIYAAKQRPADNPLIVHFASLGQLRELLRNGVDDAPDPIPKIYHPLIRRFWPGPLTLIMPLPSPSPLAPEVTANLTTFGARMPRSAIALLLIALAERPIAAPSANASTKPSPTAAEHVYFDLQGRIATVLDGGPCDVGVESTVVDGLGQTPVVLRPGGVSMDELRACEGWEDVRVAYKDKAEMVKGEGDGEGEGDAPRAPGMKYRHYSPRATVVLFEAGAGMPGKADLEGRKSVGLIRTKSWPEGCGVVPKRAENRDTAAAKEEDEAPQPAHPKTPTPTPATAPPSFSNLTEAITLRPVPQPRLLSNSANETETDAAGPAEVWEVNLGTDTKAIARGLFSALRELDRKDVEAIFVEGIDEREGDVAAAVMNRLRKAAEKVEPVTRGGG
ncbi:uncharacterized protein K452DRAFT_218107 [Aplosporella prunicola CBS 121167]|uniref:Threonylcarbamoyl-AMP synthase n=1 Tax=Aplosporella prunicola CBS 121167 TaxID=1176127 RepID=A0A6A6BTQ3_9PEZI|nr:uncharacterized protein K452DRAFT_218107 [Aplosporella prunicola CBS 121167]KAF2147370.1 hypothetical protein K452DRAFT_218107 [Aplosporella prunicola CBS 121167]